MKDKIRHIEVSVISDVHLATMACNAKLLLKYLKSIHPDLLVLNGDIIDAWRFSRNYFPKSHLKVIRQFLKMLEKGIKIVYITGNHDDVLRKFCDFKMGNLSIVNQYEFNLFNQKIWIFHGDVFDDIIHQSPFLAKTGAAIKGFLSLINEIINTVFKKIVPNKRFILYKSMKSRIINERASLVTFEKSIAEAAIGRNVDIVICGHSHFPDEKVIEDKNGSVKYLNCGDWVENFTSVECINGVWSLHYYKADIEEEDLSDLDDYIISDKRKLFRTVLNEIISK